MHCFVKTLPYNALIINISLLFDEIVDKTFVNESRFGIRLLFLVNIFAESIRFREPMEQIHKIVEEKK